MLRAILSPGIKEAFSTHSSRVCAPYSVFTPTQIAGIPAICGAYAVIRNQIQSALKSDELLDPSIVIFENLAGPF